VQYVIRARAKFAAAHQLPDSPGHDQNHGHVYTVIVSEEARLNPATKRLTREPEQLESDLRELLAELDRRDLNTMLMGAEPTMVGIAQQVLERLALVHPVIRCVVREDDGPEVVVMREIRK
jgi:6-pyruvoyl-tetrahydropterin synthase